MNREESIISVENLSLSYEDFEVLNNVSFKVKRGTCMVIMGGSGCGKSTLLKSMIGLLKPKAGNILYKKARCMVCPKKTESENLEQFWCIVPRECIMELNDDSGKCMSST